MFSVSNPCLKLVTGWASQIFSLRGTHRVKAATRDDQHSTWMPVKILTAPLLIQVAACGLEKQTRMTHMYGFWDSCRRLRQGSRPLASVRPNLGHCGHWGSYKADGRSRSVSHSFTPLCNYTFQTNKINLKKNLLPSYSLKCLLLDQETINYLFNILL